MQNDVIYVRFDVFQPIQSRIKANAIIIAVDRGVAAKIPVSGIRFDLDYTLMTVWYLSLAGRPSFCQDLNDSKKRSVTTCIMNDLVCTKKNKKMRKRSKYGGNCAIGCPEGVVDVFCDCVKVARNGFLPLSWVF
jgi:hypothetical protein